MSALPACMCMDPVYAWCPQKAEDGIRSTGTGVSMFVSYHVGLRIKPGSSRRASVLLISETFLPMISLDAATSQ